jgi:hypothetical protein
MISKVLIMETTVKLIEKLKRLQCTIVIEDK